MTLFKNAVFPEDPSWVHSTSAGLQLPVTLAQGFLMPFLAPEGTHTHVHSPHIHIFKSILKYFEIIILKFIIKMLPKRNHTLKLIRPKTLQFSEILCSSGDCSEWKQWSFTLDFIFLYRIKY